MVITAAKQVSSMAAIQAEEAELSRVEKALADALADAAEAAAPAVVEEEDDGADEEEEEEEDDDAYGAMESLLCGEGSVVGRSAASAAGKQIKTEMMPNAKLSHATQNDALRSEKFAAKKGPNHTGRDDRATSEQVLDPRTRLILFKLLSRDYLASIDGCISTGKEANVYFAQAGAGCRCEELAAGEVPPSALAVKVYKTSILVFRDREKYVDGEYRFRHGYSRGKNPRKMVQQWAEKARLFRTFVRRLKYQKIETQELRNYKRLRACGVLAPRPLLLKSNVLIMDFIGDGGWPAPRLKDAELSEKRVREAYWQTCRMMRAMFARCKLVHGDLSEYNMLWHDNRVFIIDVSQSVEMDHPRATEFLRMDCKNVNDFFQKRIEPMTNAELYDFVVNGSPGLRGIEDEDIDAALQARLDASALRTEDDRKSDDAVFMAAFLPRSLNELSDNCERAQRELNAGGREQGYVDAVNALLGATPDDDALLGATPDDDDAAQSVVQGDDADRRCAADGDAADGDAAAGDFDDAATASDSDDGGSDDESYDDGPLDPNGRLPNRDRAERAAVKLLKKDAAKAQKLETREARKKKMKKHVKKKATKATKNNK